MSEKNKKYIGKLISVHFKDREPISGLVVDFNDEWTLMKNNTVDYVMDGYIIFKHKNITGFCRGKDEKFREKVIQAKGVTVMKEDIVPLTDLATILQYLTKHFDVFQIETSDTTMCHLGALISIDKKHLIMDYMNPKGKWSTRKKIKCKDIRIIEFNSDYINSLKALGEPNELSNKY